jgi:hypothetical protein
VHESGRTSNEGFVHFDFAIGTTEFYKILVVHGEANAVHHVPCGLLSDTESTGNLVRTDSVLAVRQHPHGNHPLVHAERGVLKDSSNLDGELLFASLAVPDAPRRDKRMLRSFTARACDLAIRPAQHYRIVERLSRVAKEGYCLLQGLWKCEALCHG